MRQLSSLFIAVLAILLVGGCGDSGSDDTGNDDAGPSVVVTTTILGDVLTNIVGDAASVQVLLPPGTDPHEYQPSSQQVAAIASADLVVANGLGLEESLIDVLDSAAEDGANVVEIAPLVDPLPFSREPAAGLDPHVWLDPLRMADAVRLIAVELAAVDQSGDWPQRAEMFADELIATHDTITDMLAGIPTDARVLVTNHDVLGYFAERYGFEIAGTIVPGGTTLADPSSAELADLVTLMAHRDIPAIFVETTEPQALAEAIAAELDHDVAVVPLHTESVGEPGSGAETLIGMLQTNAALIAEALA